MSFSSENGYTPTSIEDLMELVRENVNEQFNAEFTTENFVGTGWYKFYYAMIQRLQVNEVKASEIFAKLQQYIPTINAMISRPVTSSPGLIDKLREEGYLASLQRPTSETAGEVHVCVDVDENAEDYAETRLDICTILKDSVVHGNPTFGTEEETIVLSNGQAFDYKFYLPERIPVALRLTIPVSENNQVFIESPEDSRIKLFQNIAERYQLGKNFEPAKYFDIDDAPWSSGPVLEWTDDVTDGEIDEEPTWHTEVFDADFDQVFVIDLALIEIAEE